jgi:hypothetical protein
MEKDIAVICFNKIIKFYNPDGTRKKEHPTGFFFNQKDLEELKKTHTVIFNF